MLRRCIRCGSSFEGQKEQRLCPSCREQAAHKPRMISHVCKSCGATFTGGPRASFCPECKAERDKQAVKNVGTLLKIRPFVKLDLPISVSGVASLIS